MNRTAIIIFAFSRKKSLENLLNSIKRNKDHKEFTYFFFVDGPRNDEDMTNIRGVIQVIDEFSIQNKKIKISKQNQGLSKSIISGISEVTKTFDKFIVLEDDLVLSDFFLSFMEKSLRKFKHENNIINISGFSNLPFAKGSDGNYYLSRRSTSWGWASWSHQWSKIDFSDKNIYTIFCYIKLFLISPDLPIMLHNQKKGNVDSWAIKLIAHQAIHNVFSVTPTKSLVRNEGVDEFATNVDLIFQNKQLCNQEHMELKKIQSSQLNIDISKWFFELYLSLKRYKSRIFNRK